MADFGGCEDGFLERTTLDNQAIATSSPVGTPLSCDDGSIAHHLFDPRSGKPGAHWQSVSVIAGRAVVADGLSTAIAVFTPDRAQDLLRKGGGQRAVLLAVDGELIRL